MTDLSRYTLTPLREEELFEAVALCDECVGRNMYSAEELSCAIDSEERFFYLLRADDGMAVGYVYFYMTDIREVAKKAKLDVKTLKAVCPRNCVRAGQLQSIGIKEEYRRTGLSAKLIKLVEEKLNTDVIFVICWKMGERIPLSRPLKACGYTFLAEAVKVWNDHEHLHCSYCNGRCECDAHIYYKLTDRSV